MPNPRMESQMLNEAIFEQLSTPGQEKQAADAINEFTRTTMREDGVYRKVIPPLTITPDDLDRQYDTDKPSKIIDKEPGNPPAVSLPFGTLPVNTYILGPRYRVSFDRIVSPRFVKDVVELQTWSMDIRQVMSDNAIKDMLTEEDSKFFATTNTAMGGSQGATNPTTGVVQWQAISGGVSRNSLEEAKKIMPRTPFHLEAVTAIVNNVTIKDVEKWGRDEMGGDFSQDLVKQGWSEKNFLGLNFIITIKRDLVPDDSMFMYADPKFIGKNFNLEDTTMYIKKEAYMVEFFAYQCSGGAIGHSGGLARADFT